MYVNKQNVLIFLVTIAGVVLLKVVGAAPIIASIYAKRSWIEFIIAGVIGALSFTKALSILKRRGVAGFLSPDFQILGPIGDITLKGVLLFTAMYSGFIVTSLILLDQFPADVPREGLVLILLLMGYLFAVSGFHTSRLIYEVFFTPTLYPAEGKLEMHEEPKNLEKSEHLIQNNKK